MYRVEVYEDGKSGKENHKGKSGAVLSNKDAYAYLVAQAAENLLLASALCRSKAVKNGGPTNLPDLDVVRLELTERAREMVVSLPRLIGDVPPGPKGPRYLRSVEGKDP